MRFPGNIFELNSFSRNKFINIHLLLTVKIQNELIFCENIGIDHTLQAIQYEKKKSPKLFKRTGRIGYCLGQLSNTSFVVFGAERVEIYIMLA